MTRFALLITMLAALPAPTMAADCAAPLDFLKSGITSLKDCRPKPANAFATSACLDASELSVRDRESYCRSLDGELRSIAADTSLAKLRRAIERTAGIVATVGLNLVQLDYQDGSRNRPLTEQVLSGNTGPDSLLAALATPQAFRDFTAYRRPNSVLEPDIVQLLEKGGNRFAYVVSELSRTTGRSWTWAALLRIEADRHSDRFIRLDLKGRFDASRVGDVNPAGILIESWSERRAGREEAL